jgi:hypothetical protein
LAIQIANQVGLGTRLEIVERELPLRTVAERVAFARERFAHGEPIDIARAFGGRFVNQTLTVTSLGVPARPSIQPGFATPNARDFDRGCETGRPSRVEA